MASWQQLDDELDNWHRAGTPATLWWRDDDACVLTPQLEKLINTADLTGVPLHLAVIPAKLEKPATIRLLSSPNTRILQHGFSHIDYAPAGQGSWELGDHRPLATVLAELRQGYQILNDAFGEKFLPVLVPPWTRCSDKVRSSLSDQGFKGFSAEGERDPASNDSNVKVIHAHSDPIKWKENARFKGADRVLDDFINHLQKRRQGHGQGQCDPGEPTGLCTHHMDHSPELWQFLDQFLGHTKDHAGARWIFLDDELK